MVRGKGDNMAKISLEKWAEVHRRKWLRNAKTSKQVQFGNDPDVKWFYIEFYRFANGINRGNFPGADEVNYRDVAEVIVRSSDYKSWKNEMEISDEKQLYKLIHTLHTRYKDLTIPRY